MSKTETEMPLEERRAHWRTLVEAARESGERPSRFCQERGVDLARFYYWRRVFSRQNAGEDPAAHFALVRRDPGRDRDDAGAGELELQVYNGWRLRIPRGVDEATLRVVVGALRQRA